MNKICILFLPCLLFVSCSGNHKKDTPTSKTEVVAKSKFQTHIEDDGCEYGVTPHIDTIIIKSGYKVHIKLDVICIKNVNIYDTISTSDSEIYVSKQRDSYLNLHIDVNGVSKTIKIHKAAFIDSIGSNLAKNGTFRSQEDINFNPTDTSLSLTSYIMYTGTDSGSEISYKIRWNGKIEVLSVITADEFGD